MGLEATTYINGLVPTNPTGTDGKSQGDDHIRLIKSSIRNTFPNITGAVTVTQDQINAIGIPGVINFTGMCTFFVGTQAQIPAGWQICNGVGNLTNGTPVPDLRSKFIMGSTGDTGANPSGTSGGSTTHNHTLSVVVTPTALTIDQIPSHTHLLDKSAGSNNTPGAYVTTANGAGALATTRATGGNQTHTHGVTSSLSEVTLLPPYYALAIIVKL